MPRPKGSKNKVKSTNTQPIDFTSLIAEKSSTKEALVADIATLEENLTSIREEWRIPGVRPHEIPIKKIKQN